MSDKPMTEEATAQPPRVSQKRRAGRCGRVAGVRAREGRSVVWAEASLPHRGPQD